MALQDEVYDLFRAHGLETLASTVLNLSRQGLDDATFNLRLQESEAYTTRFAANAARRSAGMRVLSPAEYLATEQAYRRVLSSAGLPTGFYDSPDDFRGWLEGDVDPTEIQERANYAAQYVANTDPQVRQAFMDFYGIGDAELTAYALDRTRGLALLEKQRQAASIGAAAARHGFSVDRQRAELFADQGRAQIADQAFQQASEVIDEAEHLSAIHTGEDYTRSDAVDEFAGGLASAKRKRQRLAQQEAAAFSGSSGVSRESVRARGTAGSY